MLLIISNSDTAIISALIIFAILLSNVFIILP